VRLKRIPVTGYGPDLTGSGYGSVSDYCDKPSDVNIKRENSVARLSNDYILSDFIALFNCL
jgi:hypothetical protein